MSEISGGQAGSYENAGEYRYTVFQTIKTQGWCPACGAALFRVNQRGDCSAEEQFAKRHLLICDPFLNHYRELGGTDICPSESGIHFYPPSGSHCALPLFSFLPSFPSLLIRIHWFWNTIEPTSKGTNEPLCRQRSETMHLLLLHSYFVLLL